MKTWLIRVGVVLGAVTGTWLIGVIGAHPGGASTVAGPHWLTPSCLTGWYVNEDEEALLPEQKPGGLLFDGPSIAHHAVGPVGLAQVAEDGAFTVSGPVVGVLPLFKMETSTPYSTINKTAAGKYWSSKIGSGPGSQAEPVDHPGDLVGRTTSNGAYTVSTMIFSFGVGYANDTGNKALVTSVTLGQQAYPLSCPPPSTSASASASPSASASHSASPSASASASKTTTPPTTVPPSTTAPTTGSPAGGGDVTASPSRTANNLALTGSNTSLIGGIGVILIVAGAVLSFVAWRSRRRQEFTA
jgi:hypothetical protein